MQKFVRLSGLLCRLLAVAWLSIGVALPVSAQSCRPPSALMSLIGVLAALPADEDRLSPDQMRRIGTLLDQLDERRILSELRQEGLSSLTATALSVMAEAGRMTDSGTVDNRDYLRDVLIDFDAQAVLACDGNEASIYQEIQQERLGGMFTDEGVQWDEVERIVDESGMAKLGVLVTAVLTFVVVLFGADAAFRWGMALVYNRKACRIHTYLKVADRIVEGHVITLGRGGCRFEPNEMTSFDAILVHLRGSAVTMEIEDTVLGVTVSAIYHDVADFRFDEQISIKLQRSMLRHSTISPFYVKKKRNQKAREAEEPA